ncbi:MAG: hypothetical protein EZS28_002480 [Streblomastix strix]|uniref:Transmembrane protein n=1 Tax=Streblomastix strix TaxID=222440 RepID=A0A5J4X3T9_9EUKA|nr:MAG: hypothetical protein EZS28_002480 [Streblomastix strix]
MSQNSYQQSVSQYDSTSSQYDKIPSPIRKSQIIRSIFATFVQIAVMIILIVVAAVLISDYQTIAAKVVISGLRTPTMQPQFGLQLLVQKMLLFIEQLKEMDVDEITETNEEIRFINTAIRWDLNQGLEALTTSIVKDGQNKVKSAKNANLILTILLALLVIGTLLLVSLPWSISMGLESYRSHRLIDLMPIDKEQREMNFLPSMRMGDLLLDNEKEKLIDIAQIFVDSIKHCVDINEEIQQIRDNHVQVVISTQKLFNLIEKVMDDYDYEDYKQEKHQQEHILLSQRLTILGEQLRKIDENNQRTQLYIQDLKKQGQKLEIKKMKKMNHKLAVLNVVKKMMIRLYDRKFIEDDIELAIDLGLRETYNGDDDEQDQDKGLQINGEELQQEQQMDSVQEFEVEN